MDYHCRLKDDASKNCENKDKKEFTIFLAFVFLLFLFSYNTAVVYQCIKLIPKEDLVKARSG